VVVLAPSTFSYSAAVKKSSLFSMMGPPTVAPTRL
jgi:hypothetical protein